jgi:hypothetical protein
MTPYSPSHLLIFCCIFLTVLIISLYCLRSTTSLGILVGVAGSVAITTISALVFYRRKQGAKKSGIQAN